MQPNKKHLGEPVRTKPNDTLNRSAFAGPDIQLSNYLNYVQVHCWTSLRKGRMTSRRLGNSVRGGIKVPRERGRMGNFLTELKRNEVQRRRGIGERRRRRLGEEKPYCGHRSLRSVRQSLWDRLLTVGWAGMERGRIPRQ